MASLRRTQTYHKKSTPYLKKLTVTPRNEAQPHTYNSTLTADRQVGLTIFTTRVRSNTQSKVVIPAEQYTIDSAPTCGWGWHRQQYATPYIIAAALFGPDNTTRKISAPRKSGDHSRGPQQQYVISLLIAMIYNTALLPERNYLMNEDRTAKLLPPMLQS